MKNKLLLVTVLFLNSYSSLSKMARINPALPQKTLPEKKSLIMEYINFHKAAAELVYFTQRLKIEIRIFESLVEKNEKKLLLLSSNQEDKKKISINNFFHIITFFI